MWGISQATDLLSNRHEPTNDEINILLICPRDPRSILKTIANALVHNPSERIRFYVVEEHAHVLARHVLLLHAFFDESMPVRQRVQMYLEIFGNEKVTEKSANYVKEKARHLMDLVLDEKHVEGMEDVFDLSLLKQRDRDDLVSVFESWRRSTTSESNDARDKLLRRFYGNRYDSRIGVVDWDYHTSIKPVASIIHLRQFREWRLTGQAFEFGAAAYTVHNPTHSVSGLDGKGCSVDVSTGPFVSLGIDCERSNGLTEELFQVHNKGTGAEQHRYSSIEVALFNMTSFIWAVTTGEKYEMTISGDVFSGLVKNESKVEINPLSNKTPKRQMFCIIPVKSCKPIYRKQKFNHYFQRAFIAHNATSILKDEHFYDLLENNTKLFVETCRFDLTKNESYKKEFLANVRQVLSNVKAVEMAETNDNKIDDVLQFTITKP
ncbi:hypothetical protein ACHAWX_002434 [Stephanocyclus meneghinianus]